MKADKKRCAGCENHFPATTDHFYVKGENKNGSTRLDYVCIPCRVAINRTAEARRKAAQAVLEMVGPIKPKRQAGRPVGSGKKTPERCPVPQGVAMRSAWRGPVPAGYGA